MYSVMTEVSSAWASSKSSASSTASNASNGEFMASASSFAGVNDIRKCPGISISFPEETLTLFRGSMALSLNVPNPLIRTYSPSARADATVAAYSRRKSSHAFLLRLVRSERRAASSGNEILLFMSCRGLVGYGCRLVHFLL